MKILLAGAMLLALNFPALAADAQMPFSRAQKCVPYAEAMQSIDAAGGHVLGTFEAPFTRNGHVIYYEYAGVVAVTGVAHNPDCIYMPPALVGNLGFNPHEL